MWNPGWVDHEVCNPSVKVGLETKKKNIYMSMFVAICHNVLMSFMSHIVTCFTTRSRYYVDKMAAMIQDFVISHLNKMLNTCKYTNR